MAEPAFLLDSNICIYILEAHFPRLKEKIENQLAGAIVTSTIVYAEVMRGIDRTDIDRTQRAERLFNNFPVQDFDRGAAQRYRDLPFKRASFDRLLAAHALSLDLVLITNNPTDFADIPDLRVENWTI